MNTDEAHVAGQRARAAVLKCGDYVRFRDADSQTVAGLFLRPNHPQWKEWIAGYDKARAAEC